MRSSHVLWLITAVSVHGLDPTTWPTSWSEHPTTRPWSNGTASQATLISFSTSTSSATLTPSKCPEMPSDAILLPVPSTPPPDAPQVPPDFLSFGFESAFIPNYASNTFSENLINSIAKRLSIPLTIRIGGTSGDRIPFDPDQIEGILCADGDCPVGSEASYTVGEGYFQAFERFQGQKMRFQAPMGPEVNISGSLEYVRRAYAALGRERVAGIALGNEVDIYGPENGNPYTTDSYEQDARELMTAIATDLSLPANERIFEVMNFASPSTTSDFSAQIAWEAGIDAASNIKVAATHWYQFPTQDSTDYSPPSMQAWLLNHTATVAMFNNGYAQDIAYLREHAPEIEYVLSETGASLIGPPLPFQDSFAAAIWAVDFNLYAMSMGVKRVVASQRPAAHHSLWVPDASTNSAELGDEQNLGPQVRGPWFAVPFIADFIGQLPGKMIKLVEEDLATAYAMFDSRDRLEKVALVNSRYWSNDTGSVDSEGERGNMTLRVPISGPEIKSVMVRRLRADDGAHALGYDAGGEEQMITWAGETWSYSLDGGSGHLVVGVESSEKVEVCDGAALVVIEDTGAALVLIER